MGPLVKGSREGAPGGQNCFPPSPETTSHGNQGLCKAGVQHPLSPGPSSLAQSKHPGGKGEERRGGLLGPLRSWGLFPWVSVVPRAWGQFLTVKLLRPHGGAWCHACKPRHSQPDGRELGWAGQGVFAVPSPQDPLGRGTSSAPRRACQVPRCPAISLSHDSLSPPWGQAHLQMSLSSVGTSSPDSVSSVAKPPRA